MPTALHGDAAKTSIREDQFGLKNSVQALSKALTEQIGVDGYILGIQGPWGSGKSSFANFIAEEMQRRMPAHRIIRFEPWLVGQKGALLAVYLGQLARSVDKASDSLHPWWRLDYWLLKKTQKSLAGKVRKYGEYAAVLATPATGLAASDPSGTLAVAAMGLTGVGYVRKLLGGAPSLEVLKGRIASDLREMRKKIPDLRFTVIIDDTDRLVALSHFVMGCVRRESAI